MRIEGIDFRHPKTKMTNDDVVGLVRDHSEKQFEGDLDVAMRSVSFMLDNIGLKERYWMKDERPLDLMLQAAENAIAKSGIDKADIELLVFCGIARGFLEPADSYFIAQELELDHVDCFDVMDACMAWTRATDIVEAFFKAGRYKTAIIVNAEDYFRQGGVSYPSNFQLKNFKSIEYSFGAYCGGDGAAATVLSADGPDWERNYISTKICPDLCTVPLPGFEGHCNKTDLIALNGLGSFTSFSSRVFQNYQHMIDVLVKMAPSFDGLKAIYAHTGGDVHAYERWAQTAGAGGKVKYLFPNFGNLGTVSMPASICNDITNGDLKRGERVGCWISSSGLSFASYALTY
ncbi:MAG: ketoacyl-ACP synthase III family protein [Pseudomonadota bacterium]